MSHLNDEDRAELERCPIPKYHFEGREQSYVDELKAMPWKKLVAYCDAVLASGRDEVAVDTNGPKAVSTMYEVIFEQARIEGRGGELVHALFEGGAAAVHEGDGLVIIGADVVNQFAASVDLTGPEPVIDLTRGDAA